MLYLESYGKAGDFLYDSSDITIWLASCYASSSCECMLAVLPTQDNCRDLSRHSSGVLSRPQDSHQNHQWRENPNHRSCLPVQKQHKGHTTHRKGQHRTGNLQPIGARGIARCGFAAKHSRGEGECARWYQKNNRAGGECVRRAVDGIGVYAEAVD